MADVPADTEEGRPTEMVTSDAIRQDIARLDLELREYTSGAIGAIYRCETRLDLATQHENGDVKGCHPRRKLTGEVWAHSIHAELSAMLAFTEHFRRATSALAEEEGLRKELETRKKQISNQATAAQNYFEEAAAMHQQIEKIKEASAADHAVFTYLFRCYRGVQDGDVTSQ